MIFDWEAYAKRSSFAIQSSFHQDHILDSVAQLMTERLLAGNTIFFAGNGGSAADSMHLAAEFVGRFRSERVSLAAISLAADVAAITAIGNDYGYDEVFARQLQGLAHEGDLLVVLTTSGKSPNILKALIQARGQGVTTVAFSGDFIELLEPVTDYIISVSVPETAHIQEAHKAVGHALCAYVDLQFSK